jgi:hypothetical protein
MSSRAAEFAKIFSSGRSAADEVFGAMGQKEILEFSAWMRRPAGDLRAAPAWVIRAARIFSSVAFFEASARQEGFGDGV